MDNIQYNLHQKKKSLHEVTIKHKNTPLTDKPFNVIVEPSEFAPDPCNSIVDGPVDCQVGEPTTYDLALNDKNNQPIPTGGDDVEVVITGPNNKPLTDVCPPIDLNDGHYKVIWTPKEPGKYKVDLKVLGKSIKDKPFEVNVEEGKNLIRPVILSRYMDVIVSDEKGNVIKEAITNPEHLEIKFETVKGEKTKDLTINRKYVGEGIQRINFMVLKPGEFLISIFVGKKHIPGSPFKLCVKG